jgi:hypothetical protein
MYALISRSARKNFYAIYANSRGRNTGSDKNDSVEVQELNSYELAEQSRLNESTVIQVLNVKYKRITEKNMEFIYKNHTSYYYFWFFRKYLVPSEVKSPDSMLHAFNTIFSDSFKLSQEGHFIRKFLADKIALKKSISPNFICKDIRQHDFTIRLLE